MKLIIVFLVINYSNLKAQNFDTPLPLDRIADYATFIINNPKLGLSNDYDIVGFYLSGAKYVKGTHLPDTFKKPNHITFSTESIYSTPQHTGGVWYQVKRVWHYKPSAYVLTKHTISELKSYFIAYEKDSILDM